MENDPKFVVPFHAPTYNHRYFSTYARMPWMTAKMEIYPTRVIKTHPSEGELPTYVLAVVG